MSDTPATSPANCPRCQTYLPEPVATCPICGADLTRSAAGGPVSPTPDELDVVRAALADEYEVLDVLGRGGMAVVYHARERRLEREVAIKVLPFARTGDATFVERFLSEARIAAQLEHPSIIPIHRVGHVGEVIYFAMKLVRGSSLSRIIEERRTLPPGEIRQFLSEVGDALAYAARRGVVHRDIKPDNILQETESGRYLVSDFGIARSAEAARLTETGTTVGTPRYMSPEQARGIAVDGRSDIYSLGVVAYHCLAGRPPFDEGDSLAILYAHVHEPLPRPALGGPEEQSLFSIIERMLVKDPDRRLQSGDEVVRAALGSTEPAQGQASSATTEAASAPTRVVDRVGAAVGPAGRAVATRLRPLARYVGNRLTSVLTRLMAPLQRYRAMRWATQTLRRTIVVMLVAIGLVWGARATLHFAVKHRSRCPEGVAEASVMLDPIGSRPVGRALDVYYDVCGLAAGTSYLVTVSLSRKAGGIGGLFGGRDRPVAMSFDEEARGPATRRHRDIALPDLEAGSYTLAVLVTLADGRELAREHQFQLLDR
jgi:serine/threonine-protein kinase